MLASGLALADSTLLNANVIGSPTLPEGVVVVDPSAVTVQQFERGRPMRELEQAPANSVVVRPDSIILGAIAVNGVAAGCCGLDGQDGPNQTCVGCGQILGTAWTDCWTQHEVRFLPDAVLLTGRSQPPVRCAASRRYRTQAAGTIGRAYRALNMLWTSLIGESPPAPRCEHLVHNVRNYRGLHWKAITPEIVDRDRPPAALAITHPGGPSFPSGHPFAAAASWGFIPMVIALYTTRRWVWWVSVCLVCSLIFVIGASRIYLGAHYATDVIATLLLALVFVASSELFIGWLHRRGDTSRFACGAHQRNLHADQPPR